MASYDNRQWILSLIQNAYITTDDTGFCEEVLEPDQGSRNVAEFPFLAHTDDTTQLHSRMNEHPSPDITTGDLEFPRHRSYTERKSEKLKKEREKASRVRRITWKHNSDAEISDLELSDMFQRKTSFSRSSDTSDGEPPPPKATSLLSHLLSNSEFMNKNGFIEYSKFDGVTHNNVATKKINIYLYVGNNPCIDYPLSVSVICSARVSDLIGLICWLYTKENRQPTVKTVGHYQLYIADEDGQYDQEFLPLERGFIIDKYGFNTLALVEKELPDAKQGITITVNFARGAFSKLDVANTEVTLREILNKSISRRKEIAKIKETGVDYHLEKEDEPGLVLKLDKTLAQVQCTEFAAVRDNSKRRKGSESDVSACQSFVVTWVHKLRKYETRIDISGDKLELHPLPMKGTTSILPLRVPLPIFYHTNQMIECNKKNVKKGKIELHITVRGEDSFKGFKFVCDPVVGQQVYDKCQCLIKMNSTKFNSSEVKNSFSEA